MYFDRRKLGTVGPLKSVRLECHDGTVVEFDNVEGTAEIEVEEEMIDFHTTLALHYYFLKLDDVSLMAGNDRGNYWTVRMEEENNDQA